MSLTSSTFDDIESMAFESTIQELDSQKRTPLKASAPQFKPSGAWGSPMVPNFADEMHMNAQFHDNLHANRDRGHKVNAEDGNVYMFNLDLVLDLDSDSDSDSDSDVDEPSACRTLYRPVPGLPVGPPPGLEAVAAWPEHLAVEQQQEVRPKTPWWRQPCPFIAQDISTPAKAPPVQRPWRRLEGHDAARSLLHPALADMTANEVQRIEYSNEKKLADYSDSEDTDTTGGFKSDTEEVDSE